MTGADRKDDHAMIVTQSEAKSPRAKRSAANAVGSTDASACDTGRHGDRASRGDLAVAASARGLRPPLGVTEEGHRIEADFPEFTVQSKRSGADVEPGLFGGMKTVEPPPAGEPMGFFTDASICIGCKACEVACKQWNGLPADGMSWRGKSYDNTLHLSATTWRHVSFAEQVLPDGGVKWLFNSDVCKHCTAAPCQEACPTGALIYNELGNVYVQQDVCNGCGYCVSACPFGVIGRSELGDGLAHKCTLCYDRQRDGLEPACAKSCPTNSIAFGPVSELKERARTRVEELRSSGEPNAYLYGADDSGDYQSLNAFFLLTEKPEAYNLPPAPTRPVAKMVRRYMWSAAVGVGLSAVSALALAKKGGG